MNKEIEVVHNFIDPDRHDMRMPTCIPEKTSDRQVTLMHISNFRALKRTDDVVRIFARVQGRHGRAAGSGR